MSTPTSSNCFLAVFSCSRISSFSSVNWRTSSSSLSFSTVSAGGLPYTLLIMVELKGPGEGGDVMPLCKLVRLWKYKTKGINVFKRWQWTTASPNPSRLLILFYDSWESLEGRPLADIRSCTIMSHEVVQYNTPISLRWIIPEWMWIKSLKQITASYWAA